MVELTAGEGGRRRKGPPGIPYNISDDFVGGSYSKVPQVQMLPSRRLMVPGGSTTLYRNRPDSFFFLLRTLISLPYLNMRVPMYCRTNRRP